MDSLRQPGNSDYDILGVSPGASDEEIRNAFSRLIYDQGYRVGVPRPGVWKEIGNSDAEEYGGSGVGNLGGCEGTDVPAHGHPASMEVTIPPLGAVYFRPPAARAASPSLPTSPRKRGEGESKSVRRRSSPSPRPSPRRGEGEKP